jgi:glycerol-3-phosphate dehydrogenase (NAD(P)+)
VVEWVQPGEAVMRLAERHGLELPISALVRRVLHEEITPVEGLQLLLSREQKPEYPHGLFE